MAQVLPMIRDDKENYTAISNDLFAAILHADFTKRQLLVLLTLIRKTCGYRKSEDDLSASQIGRCCGMARPHVTATLNELARMNVITKRPGNYGCLIGVQKDSSLWILSSKKEQENEPEKVQKTRRATIQKTDQKTDVDSTETVINTDTETVQDNNGTSTEKPVFLVPKKIFDSTTQAHTKENLTKENYKRKYICAPTLFERFYQAYPRKRSRQQAERAFAKLKPTDELVDQMLAAIEKAKTSGRWDNVEYIPYPSTWLNAHGWLDDLTTDYSDRQKAVIRSYNDTLSDKTGVIDETIFTESRASAIDAFLTFSVKPNFWEKYFSWISENVDLPPHVGFDWMISRSGFTKVKGGQFARG